MRKENKVIAIPLSGGIIGWLSSSPRKKLESKINIENKEGWSEVQVIGDNNTNFIVQLIRAFILLITLFLWTKMDGYYVVLEREIKS